MAKELDIKVKELKREITRRYPHANVRREFFPQGPRALDVRMGDRLFVWIYDPKEGFGVDEVKSEDGGFESGYRYVFGNFEPSRECLLGLLITATEDLEEANG